MDEVKTFLFPQMLRRGQPTLIFIGKEKSFRSRPTYWLGTYHQILPCTNPPYNGTGEEYAAVSRSAISRTTYEALLREAKANAKKFVPRDQAPATRRRKRRC